MRAESVGTPVLVGGCSRSGTTLLGAMLGWGPGRLTVPEADFKWELFAAGAAHAGRVDLARARPVLLRDPKFALWEIDPPKPSPGIGGEGGGSTVSFDAMMTGLVRAHARVRGASAEVAWVDHTPGNVRFVATLLRLLPGGRFVHVVRDGRAVAASVLPLDWGPNTAVEAARHWGLQVAAGLAAARTLGPDLVHTVRFEDLLIDPESTLKSVCAFAGLEYDDRMVEERDYRLPGYSSRQHALVASRPEPGRIGAWRHTLRPDQVRAFERLTGELLDLLGYPTDYGIAAGRQTPGEHYGEVAASFLRRLAVDRVRRGTRWRRRALP